MARLLTIASAILAAAGTALAVGVCPDSLSNSYPSFTEYEGDNTTYDCYYGVSLTTPNSGQADSTTDCSTSADGAYVSRYTDSDEDQCVFYANTKVSSTVLTSGCLYEYTTNLGDTLVYNMSCSDYSSVNFDDAVYITDIAGGKKKYSFTGYSYSFCTPTTETDGPTQTWTDGPTQTWTDGPTQTWTDGPTQTYTDGPTHTDGTVTPSPTVVYTYLSFYTSTSSGSYLVSYLRDYLNVSYPNYYGEIDASCGQEDSVNNYTCVASFTNATQSNESYYGATHGYVRNVYNASWYTPTTTPTTTIAPVNYTNTTFIYNGYYTSYLVGYIRDYLNVSSYPYYGTIDSVCNTSYNTGNWNCTCNVTFSNYTQAVQAVDGGNHGWITNVVGAWFGGGSTTPAPQPTNPDVHSDTASAMGVLIGAMAGFVIFLALLSIIYILVGRRRQTYSGDYEHLSEMNRANSNLKRV